MTDAPCVDRPSGVDDAAATLDNRPGSSLRLRLTSPTAYRWPVGEMVTDLLSHRVALAPDLRGSIAIAIHEAVLNAVIHGNLEIESPTERGFEAIEALRERIAARLRDPCLRDRKCEIRLRWTNAHVLAWITDEGPGFTPRQGRNPELPWGRGIQIIRALASRCRWRKGGRRLALAFKL